MNKGIHELTFVISLDYFGILPCINNKPIKPINNRKQEGYLTHALIVTEYFSSKEAAQCVVRELCFIADNLISGASFSAEFDENYL